MKLPTLALTALFALGSSADNSADLTRPSTGSCLSKEEAGHIVNIYQTLISAYKPDDAKRYLTADFVGYSDSINTCSGKTLGTITFADRKAFMEAQVSREPFPLKVQATTAVGCQSVSFTWQASFGSAEKTIRGVSALQVGRTGRNREWQIRRLDMEMSTLR